jgi:hypothetical protein
VSEVKPMGRGIRCTLGWLAAGAILAQMVAGCNGGFGAFQEGVGNTPNKAPLSAFRVLGQPGMQFSATVSASDATWYVQGAVPTNIILINTPVIGGEGTPVRMIATKLSPGNGILSLQLTTGFTVRYISSTASPYGTVSLQNNGSRPGSAPPAPFENPDVRLFVKGPLSERFSGQFEDSVNDYILDDRVPALVLFDHPDGSVDATLNQIQNLGPFSVDLLFNGAVVAHASGGPTITIRQP